MHYLIDFYGVPILLAILLALVIAAVHRLRQRLHHDRAAGAVVRHHPRHVLRRCSGVAADHLARLPGADPRGGQGRSGSWLGAADWASADLVPADRRRSSTCVLTRTRWGLHTISVGGNLARRHRGRHPGQPDQDRQLHDRRPCSARFAGIMEAFRINTIDPNLGGGYADHVHRHRRPRSSAARRWPAAPARSSARFLGALVLAELQNGFNLIGISANPYFLILGGGDPGLDDRQPVPVPAAPGREDLMTATDVRGATCRRAPGGRRRPAGRAHRQAVRRGDRAARREPAPGPGRGARAASATTAPASPPCSRSSAASTSPTPAGSSSTARRSRSASRRPRPLARHRHRLPGPGAGQRAQRLPQHVPQPGAGALAAAEQPRDAAAGRASTWTTWGSNIPDGRRRGGQAVRRPAPGDRGRPLGLLATPRSCCWTSRWRPWAPRRARSSSTWSAT